MIRLERAAAAGRIFTSKLPVFVVIGKAGDDRFDEIARSFALDQRCGKKYKVLVLDKNHVQTSDVLNTLGLSMNLWHYPHPVQAFKFKGSGSSGYVRWDVRTEAEKRKDGERPELYRPKQSTDL